LRLLEREQELARQAGVPVDKHSLVYLAAEHMAKEHYQAAMAFLREYLDRPPDWPAERAQVHHRLALCLLRTGNAQAAVATELASLQERPDWAETAAGLTQAYATLGRWDEVERWALRTLELGPPRSELPVNPAEFTFLPLIHLSEACFRQGRPDKGQEWLARAWATRDAPS
jgi:tetratricopeptide (TPR) repeat protein